MKKIALAFALSVLAAFSVCAQSAEKISEIIESGQITYGQAAWLSCSYAGQIDDDADYEKALEAASKNGWISGGASSSQAITLKSLCGLCVKASGLKGGLFYRISKADRYAFKELKANGILDSAADPAMTVSGQNAVAILNACAKKAGGAR